MKYELAKELKDAGYRQPDRHEMYGGVYRSPEGINNSFAPDAVYVPSLEELIDACGDGFIELRGYMDRTWWVAGAWHPTIGNTWISKDGSTPAEAVARLFITLNKKV